MSEQHPNGKWRDKFKRGEIFVLEGVDFFVVSINRRGLTLKKVHVFTCCEHGDFGKPHNGQIRRKEAEIQTEELI